MSHTVWYAIASIGSFAFWALMDGLGSWGGMKPHIDRMEAEQRDREQIKRNYDLLGRRD